MRWSTCVAFQVLLVFTTSCVARGGEQRETRGEAVTDGAYLECKTVIGHAAPIPREQDPFVAPEANAAQCRSAAGPTPIYGATESFRLGGAEKTTDELGYPAVEVTIDPSDAKRFEEWSGALVGKEVAMFFQGELLLSATVASPLPGRAVLSGGAGGWSDEHVSVIVARMNDHHSMGDPR